MALDLRPLQTASRRRGVGTYVRQLARALGEARQPGDALLGLVAAAQPWPEEERLVDRLLPVGGPARGRTLADAVWLPALLRREAIEVYHASFFAPPPRPPRGVAIVQTVHDLTALRFPHGFTRRQRWVLRRVFRRAARADRVIAVSEATRADLERLARVPASRIEVIPPGIDPIFFAKVDGRGEGAGVEGPYLLHVGGYDPIKNLGAALRALRRLRGEGFPHRLVVAGEGGPHAARFGREADDLGLGGAVVMAGFVPVEALAALYRGCDLVLYPSLHEGFGLPPLEAMACGAPVIAARAGSLPEVLGDAAVLVDPRDPDALARAAASLLRSAEARHALRERGRARAALYRWPDAAARTWEVYRSAQEAAR